MIIHCRLLYPWTIIVSRRTRAGTAACGLVSGPSSAACFTFDDADCHTPYVAFDSCPGLAWVGDDTFVFPFWTAQRGFIGMAHESRRKRESR